MEYATPLSPWKKWLAIAYWLLVLFLFFFGDDHGFLIAFATMPWFLVLAVLLMLGEMLGVDVTFVLWEYPLQFVMVLIVGGINAAWIAGLLGRTRFTFMGIHNKDSS